MTIKDYRVTVKVRNNRIIKAIELSGGSLGGKWCEANGLCYGAINNLVNMTASPLGASGYLSAQAKKLCDVLGAFPDDLWAPEQLRPLEINYSTLEMSHEQVMALLPSEQASYLEDFDKFELAPFVLEKLKTLSENEQEVLMLRFGIGGGPEHTLEEIAVKRGVSRERIREIEGKAMRKLRHPIHATELKLWIDPESVSLDDIAEAKAKFG